MDDKELFNTWKKSDEHERNVFKKHEGDYQQLAKRQSNDVFKKIRRNVIIELSLTIIFALVFFPAILYFQYNQETPNYQWILTILVFVVSILGIIVYSKYLRDIKGINEISIVDSLKKKLRILSNYIRQLKILVIVFGPVFYSVGVYVGLGVKEIDFYKLLKIVGISIPILLVF